MLILIKSFKRPFLLDFTIQSIKKNVLGNYLIVVLDDGTPERFLEKLSEKYPDVKIEKSIYYFKKSDTEEVLLNAKQNIILPHKDWVSIVRKYSKDYVIILEDDQFITNKLDVEELRIILSENKLMFLHFNVLNKFIDQNLGNSKRLYFYNSKKLLLRGLSLYYFTGEGWILTKMRSLLSRIQPKLFSFNFLRDALPLYDLFVISGAVYNKSYYIECHSGSKDELDEFSQLKQAVIYNLRRFGRLKFAITLDQKVKTSFCTTVLSGARGVDFNPLSFNEILNSYWFQGDLNYFDSNLWDVNNEVIKIILNNSNCSITGENWEKYSEKFKNNYRNIGFRL